MIMKANNIYVTMTDKFMSGWGKAENKVNKFIVVCETMEQARAIERNAKKCNEMKYINICFTKPCYNKDRYVESVRSYDELGVIWKE